MAQLRAVLFGFSGVIFPDEALRQQVFQELLLTENICLKLGEYPRYEWGRGDRDCLEGLLRKAGRAANREQTERLILKKVALYQQLVANQAKLSTYSGIADLLFQIKGAQIPTAVVSGRQGAEVDWVLQQVNLAGEFAVLITDDQVRDSKPAPESYLKALEHLNAKLPGLQPQECLAVESSPAGIEAAKAAKMSVVGVAHNYPLHCLQRWTDWVVDYLDDLDLERVRQVFSQR